MSTNGTAVLGVFAVAHHERNPEERPADEEQNDHDDEREGAHFALHLRGNRVATVTALQQGRLRACWLRLIGSVVRLVYGR